MICYKDMTFCCSDCTNSKCERHWDDKKRADARKWWGSDEGVPVAFADFSPTCESYEKPEEIS